MLTLETIRQAPKALLHDHLDGGLRPATVVDLTSTGYKLPPLRLLDAGTGGEVNRRSLEETAHQLEETLIQHGVDATLTKIVPGPSTVVASVSVKTGQRLICLPSSDWTIAV
jgi:DNA segregation ATPase FtsK/SpoIIIE-like protein